ncbi:MAG: squalene/phytoene synthase family protein [Sphingomicrobium sp.]
MAERALDSDRLTALATMPADVRAAFATLWDLDLALADVVATTSEPALGAIRLAWWRERLEELDAGAPPPGEPRLGAIARELVARGITGTELSQLEDAWLPLLHPFPWGEPQAEALRLRGCVLFGIGARLLGRKPEDAEAAGALWSVIDGALHCSDADSRHLLCAAAQAVRLPCTVPNSLRPLTVLAAVAVAAVTHPGSGAARGMAAVRHRATGRFARLS